MALISMRSFNPVLDITSSDTVIKEGTVEVTSTKTYDKEKYIKRLELALASTIGRRNKLDLQIQEYQVLLEQAMKGETGEVK